MGKLCNPRNFYTGHRIHQMTSKIPSKYETLMPTPTGRSLGAYCSHSLLPALHQPARLFSPVLQNNLWKASQPISPAAPKPLAAPTCLRNTYIPTQYISLFKAVFLLFSAAFVLSQSLPSWETILFVFQRSAVYNQALPSC